MSEVIKLVGGESNAHYSLFVNLGEYSYEFTLDYVQAGQWMLAILPDGDTGELPLVNIDGTDYVIGKTAIEPGGDIVRPYQITDTFGQLFLVGEEPTLDNLGTDNTLVWVPPEEVRSFA